VHANGPGPWRVAELQGTGWRGDHDAVGVLVRRDVGAGADAKRRPEVDDEHRPRHRWQRQPGVRRRALQVVEVVDQPVQRWSRHSDTYSTRHSIADARADDAQHLLDGAVRHGANRERWLNFGIVQDEYLEDRISS
jgi:hypothetical protein